METNSSSVVFAVAIERNIDAVNAATGATVYRVGHVQFYRRDRNKLNFIIIPISVAIVVFLFVLTFVLRRLRFVGHALDVLVHLRREFRDAQKRRHIVAELEKKKGAESKKATTANPDPRSDERDRLLQLDPTVVGSASGTLGSPKDFTNEQYSGPARTTRDVRSANSAGNFDSQRSLRSSRERMQSPYDQEQRFPPHQYDAEHPDMIPMREPQPRTVIRTIHGDGSPQRDEPGVAFVPIPVQVERSGPHQRHASPYHSDPYYRHGNS